MEELFIWFYSTPNALPKGVPATVMTLLQRNFTLKTLLKSSEENGLNTLLCFFHFLQKINTNCLRN